MAPRALCREQALAGTQTARLVFPHSLGLRTLHLAGRGDYRVLRLDLADLAPTPAGVLLIEALVLLDRTDRGHVKRLEDLMDLGADPPVAAGARLELGAFEARD